MQEISEPMPRLVNFCPNIPKSTALLLSWTGANLPVGLGIINPDHSRWSPLEPAVDVTPISGGF